jgi:hypothetical protein
MLRRAGRARGRQKPALPTAGTSRRHAIHNAGEQAVLRYGSRVPPFAETREFVRLVEQFQRLFSPAPPKARSRLRLKLPGKRVAVGHAEAVMAQAASSRSAGDGGHAFSVSRL